MLNSFRRRSGGRNPLQGAKPSGPRGGLLLGHLRLVQRDPLGFFTTLAREHRPIAHYRLGFFRAFLISQPEHIKHVLQDHQKNYSKDVLDYRILKWLLGDGLLTSGGPFWLRQRRLVQPAFHRERIEAYGKIMTDAAEAMLARRGAAAAQGRPLELMQEMMGLTLQVVGRALFGSNMQEEIAAVTRSFSYLNADLSARMFALRFIPPVLPTRRDRAFRAALCELDSVVSQVITERRRTGADTGDLLSLLLHARDEETGEQMSDRQLGDEVRTLLLAGHETTALALTWTWYLLSQHPEVEERLRAELASVLGGRTPDVQDLPKLAFTRMVIEEAMRLYPPAWGVTRKVVADDVIGGFLIPAGSIVAVSPYVTHRHPDVWENPERFDPDRFAPQHDAARPRYAYFPFLGGPRQCIGNSFAMTEALLILATIAQRYRLRLVPNHPVAPEALITLRPRHGMLMMLHPA
ncbi:MAG TPA: cytochrome P450 [Longimicrobiaceae bacterium]|nr:cytochrome P450 [Longimicrobiaceae bacterium]